MFETFRKQGSFRIDYLNNAARGSPEAYAFYVRGEVDNDAPYSITAKHHLCAGLNIIRKNMNCDYLVAIYVDINQAAECLPAGLCADETRYARRNVPAGLHIPFG
jgi:hypothetical protein